MNRLVSTGLTNIRTSQSPIPFAGKGLFAARAVARNEVLFNERPFLAVLRRTTEFKSNEVRNAASNSHCHLCWSPASSSSSFAYCDTHSGQSAHTVDPHTSFTTKALARLASLPGFDNLNYHQQKELQLSSGREGAFSILVTHLLAMSLADLLTTGSFANSYALFGPLLKAKEKPLHAIPQEWADDYNRISNVLLTGKGLSDLFPLSWYADQLTRLNLNSIACHFSNTDNTQRMEGTAVYLTAAMMNHSCLPNVRVDWFNDNTIRVIADRDIEEGEELSISYVGPVDVASAREEDVLAKRKEFFRFNYGFVCTCPLCSGKKEAKCADEVTI
ncbi:hypothetical protein HDU78_002164 [Chytriomyces hyalinus]|nr:hypothetical protein HDU78_002164 [Chytriomyces hyalinus]